LNIKNRMNRKIHVRFDEGAGGSIPLACSTNYGGLIIGDIPESGPDHWIQLIWRKALSRII
jgi:hypothetical protein